MLLPGDCEDAGGSGGRIVPRRHRARFRKQAAKYGAAVRLDKADRLGTHSIHRGAVRAILGAGGSLAQLLGAGQWHPAAYRLFLDSGVEETKAVASVPI